MGKLLAISLLLAIPTVVCAQDDDDEWLDNCRSMRGNSGRATACAVVVKTLPARTLIKVRPGQNGAVKIVAHEAAGIEVHARHQAHGESMTAANRTLEEIKVDLGETISAAGPETERGTSWSTSFVVYVPRNTNVDVTTHNGPIAVKNVIGNMELSAQNGPISLSAVGGNVRARAQNGPIQVRLAGTRWQGAGLDAETQNGPIQLEIPQNYNAELETGTINGPMQSEFPINVTLSGKHWKRFSTQLGSGGPPLRVVTTNGPVALRRP